MKKLLLLIAMISLLVFGCGKKSKKAPDLNTDDFVEVKKDTINKANTIENEQVLERTEALNKKQEKILDNVNNYNSMETNDNTEGNYVVQIISLTNYDNILKIKRQLKEDGYQTELSTLNKEGKIFYRLRLKEHYSKEYAKKMGEELKSKYNFIKNYWIQKVK